MTAMMVGVKDLEVRWISNEANNKRLRSGSQITISLLPQHKNIQIQSLVLGFEELSSCFLIPCIENKSLNYKNFL